MAAAKALKQWALTEQETITSFEAWKNNIVYILSLETRFKPFLLPDTTWYKKTRANLTRGFTGNDAETKVGNLELMLGQIANFAPIISRNTIIKNSTSLSSIWESIRLYYNIQSNGARFLDFVNISSTPDKRHEALYQELVSFVEDNLLTPSSSLKHHGESITEEEEMTPTLESLLVLIWLQRIHPKLPHLVKERYGTELRNQTLASIKCEISQSLPSMIAKLDTPEEGLVMYSSSKPIGHKKECPICKAAKRRNCDHFLSQCEFLPEQDKRYFKKRSKPRMRKITVEIPVSDTDESSDECDDETPDSPSSSMLLPVARKVDVKKSPFLRVFCKENPVTVILDTGSEINMIKSSLAHYLGLRIKSTTQRALQADGRTPLDITGEISSTVTRNGISMILKALVVTEMDVDIIAGTPFMELNDIAVRPARHEITIQDQHKISYDLGPISSHSSVRRTQAYTVRAPPIATTVWPGEFVEACVPRDVAFEEHLAVEPRADSRTPDWPSPCITSALDGRIRLVNTTSEPIHLKKSEHFCQVLLTQAPEESIAQTTIPRPPKTIPLESFSSTVSVDPDNILSTDEKHGFKKLLKQYDSVFDPAYSGYNGAYGNFKAFVNMGPSLPPQRKGRIPQYAKDKLDALQDEFDRLEVLGVFQKPEDVGVVAEYLNPSFLVKKPNGGHRLVTAFAEVGKYCKPSPSTMPNVDSTLRCIASWKHLIATDLTSAFYQIPLDKGSMKFCGVSTPFKGTRVYCRAAMGMPGSETALEELMCRVVGNLVQEGVIVKLADDLYCGGNTIPELMSNFSRLLQALDKAGLRLSAHKTIICPKSTTILGWIWKEGTLSASPHRISTLSQIKPPSNTKNMRSFIGAFKFLSRVLPDCARIVAPLEDAISGLSRQDKITWTDQLYTHFAAAQRHLNCHKCIVLPRPSDTLWIVTDGSTKTPGIGSTLYVKRDNRLKLSGFYSAKLSKYHTKWLPCEVEALAIAASITHFSPYIIQSKNKCNILTDSKPCVEAIEKLCRGEWSHSPRVSTFLSTASRYQVSLQHLSGNANVPSDFASRNAPSCTTATCQICNFVSQSVDSTVRAVTVEDIISGSCTTPFANRPAWASLQSDCKELRRVHAHLTQGTRPSRKQTDIKNIKRYLNVASLSHDGLLIVKKDEPFSPTRELIIVPQTLLRGLLSAMHISLAHPSPHQLRQVMDRRFYALNMSDAIKEVSENCYTCASLKTIPSKATVQTSCDPPDVVGLSFAADVLRQNKQYIFVLRETVTSFTITSILPNENQESLRSALICACTSLRPLCGPKAVIRVDPAPGFIALRNDKTLAENGIVLEFGRTKNPDKNPVAERAVQELETELLKSHFSGNTITPMKLAITTATLNSRIRSRGLSAREMMLQRSQFTNEQIPLSDRVLIMSQSDSRTINHPHSQKSKGFTTCGTPHLPPRPGDLVFLVSDKSKSHARDRYLVSSVDGEWCFIKKFSGPQIRDTSYKVRCSDCIKVPSNLSNVPNHPPIHDDICDTLETLPIPGSKSPGSQYLDDLPQVGSHNGSNQVIPSMELPPVLPAPTELVEPPDLNVQCEKTSPITTAERLSPLPEDSVGEINNQRLSRNRQPPKWLNDYVC